MAVHLLEKEKTATLYPTVAEGEYSSKFGEKEAWWSH